MGQVHPLGIGEPLDLEAHQHTDDLVCDLVDVDITTPRSARPTFQGWLQAAYELEIDGDPRGKPRVALNVASLCSWPGRVRPSHRARCIGRASGVGTDKIKTGREAALVIEAGLMAPEDWSAQWISPAEGGSGGRPCGM